VTGTVVLVIRLLLLAALYGFLGFAFLTLWKTTQPPPVRQSPAAPRRLILTQRRPVELPGITVISSPAFIGRDDGCDIRLNDTGASNRQASLSFREAGWWIEDLGFAGGTRLNGLPLQGAHLLTTGDQIGCGETVLLVGFERPPDDQRS
jgi:pSer/pThr/pTyr-binding forkhead associated (FHA) protein